MKLEEITNVPLDAKEFNFLLSAVAFAIAKAMNLPPHDKLTISLSFAMAVEDLGQNRITELGKRLNMHFNAAWGEHYDIVPLVKEPAEPVQESAPESPAKEVA